MKLVKEYIILEKFTEDSDPIHDLGIGKIHLIEEWLKKYGINEKCTISSDLTINAYHSIDLENKKIKNFPSYIQFDTISNGYFDIKNNKFTSLRGCPKRIENGYFACSENKLTTLKYAPKYLYGDFACQNNLLTSLDYCPKIIVHERRAFICFGNKKQFTKEDVRKVCKVSNIITTKEEYDDY